MEINIKKTNNYNDLSIDCLLVLLRNFSNIYYEKKVPVIFAITKKYFEDKNSVNIYNIIQQHIKFVKLEDRLDYLLFVLGKELEGNVNDLPKEYRNDFFEVLISFLTGVEAFTKVNMGGEIEWQLSNIPKLINYLAEIENSDITSDSLRQKINVLVENIKKEFEENKKKNEEKQKETGLTTISSVKIISEKETEEKLNKIKTLKLKKSNLTKGRLCDALSLFNLYNEEDKCYLIDYMYKQKWLDCIKHINQIDAFDFFKTHTKYQSLNVDKFNPFYILSGSFYKMFNCYSTEIFNKWKDYFKVSNFNEMMVEIEKWYKSYNNSTEIGWECYKEHLFYNYFNNNNTDISDKNEISIYAQNLLIENCEKYLTYFNTLKNANIREWAKKINKIERYSSKIPVLNNFEIKEDITLIKENAIAITCYWEIFEKYHNKLFSYHGNTTEQTTIEFFENVGDKERYIIDFVKILNTISFSGSDLIWLKENNEFKKTWTNENNKKNSEAITDFIMSYFCQNYKSITNNQIKDLWFNKENYEAFCYFTDYNLWAGLFRNQGDYAEFFFKRLKDEINFGKKQDLELFFRLKSSLSINNPYFKAFYEKLEKDCSDCYNFVNEFIDGKVEKNEKDIIAFVKTYYNIN